MGNVLTIRLPFELNKYRTQIGKKYAEEIPWLMIAAVSIAIALIAIIIFLHLRKKKIF